MPTSGAVTSCRALGSRRLLALLGLLASLLLWVPVVLEAAEPWRPTRPGAERVDAFLQNGPPLVAPAARVTNPSEEPAPSRVVPLDADPLWHPSDPCLVCETPWTWQLLPEGLIFRSYLAGAKESRFATLWSEEEAFGSIWDITLGGRVGLLRYGTFGDRPDGWQLDIEGAAFPRLDLDVERDLISADFRFGIPLTYGNGPHRVKFGYYHLSSHLGDEFIVRNPMVTRINFSRDVLVLGYGVWVRDDVRLYSEAAWAFYSDVSEPWEFQFGAEYSPRVVSGIRGTPFAAVNGHIRQEVDFGGNFVAQVGWQWRNELGRLLRMGFEYFNGKSDQFEFFNTTEEKVGFGIWYDY